MRIEGNRIRLRDFSPDDLEPYTYWMQPQHEWPQYDGPYYPRSTSEEVQQHVNHLRDRIVSGNWPNPRTRFVIADVETDAIIGTVSRYWVSEETNWSAIGIGIYDPAYWSKGLGYEALGLWSEYLFNAFPEWVRLDIRTWSGNHGMMKLAQKLGYSEEARFRMARIVKGQYYDGMGYGVLREEWQTRYPQGFGATLQKT